MVDSATDVLMSPESSCTGKSTLRHRRRSVGAACGRPPADASANLDQREFDSMEEAVLAAEAALAEARRRAEDPSIAADVTALQERFAELARAEAEVDRLYERWSELEARLA